MRPSISERRAAQASVLAVLVLVGASCSSPAHRTAAASTPATTSSSTPASPTTARTTTTTTTTAVQPYTTTATKTSACRPPGDTLPTIAVSGAVSGTLCSTWVPGSERVGFFCSGQLLSQGSASQDGTDYRLAIRTDSKDPPGTFVVEVQPLRGSLLAGLAYAYDWPDGATGTVTPTADGFHFDHVVLPADPGSDRYQPATGSLTLDGDVTCRHGP